eukprot:10488380-Lingulodinium_polyedra.AAC.1
MPSRGAWGFSTTLCGRTTRRSTRDCGGCAMRFCSASSTCSTRRDSISRCRLPSRRPRGGGRNGNSELKRSKRRRSL